MSINLYDKFKQYNCITTLKSTSYDKANNHYMNNSSLKVINFDKVKEQYFKNIFSNKGKDSIIRNPPKSVDALLKHDSKVIFLEFKNGSVEGFDIIGKMKDSLLIFFDITDTTLSFSRNNVDFILVTNYFYKSESKDKDKNYISNHIINKEKPFKEFEKYYFRSVKVFTESEFQMYLTDGIQNNTIVDIC